MILREYLPNPRFLLLGEGRAERRIPFEDGPRHVADGARYVGGDVATRRWLARRAAELAAVATLARPRGR